MRGLNLRGGPEQEPGLAGLDHFQIVEAVPGRDGFKSDGLKRPDRAQLAFFAPHAEARYLSVFRRLQLIAEECRPAQLLHQRPGELGKGVAEDHHLRFRPQGIQKLARAGHRIDFLDRFLNLPQAKPVLLQNPEPEIHQLVIIRLVPGRSPQFGNPGGFGECNPDFRYEHAFQIQADNIHLHSPSGRLKSALTGSRPTETIIARLHGKVKRKKGKSLNNDDETNIMKEVSYPCVCSGRRMNRFS